MPHNIIQLHVSVLSIGHLQVVHKLLISYRICVGFYSCGETGSRLTSLGVMAMPPNIIQLHLSGLGISHLQVFHNLLSRYTICVGFSSG